ncbi:MAG: hypothetical protein H0T07_04330 [Actinobacteria bacterium]|nr:hypothetical protein [Actinomycetota bacterium]
MDEKKETFEPGDPADPDQPGYQQPPSAYVEDAKAELGEDTSWSELHKRAFELMAENDGE